MWLVHRLERHRKHPRSLLLLVLQVPLMWSLLLAVDWCVLSPMLSEVRYGSWWPAIFGGLQPYWEPVQSECMLIRLPPSIINQRYRARGVLKVATSGAGGGSKFGMSCTGIEPAYLMYTPTHTHKCSCTIRMRYNAERGADVDPTARVVTFLYPRQGSLRNAVVPPSAHPGGLAAHA